MLCVPSFVVTLVLVHVADRGKNETVRVLRTSLHMGRAPAPWVHIHTHASDATHRRPHSPAL